MNPRRSRSDDVLFLSAVITVLLGIALLLYTTRALDAVPSFWPVLVMALGGILLYFALVRGASATFLFTGILLTLEGAFFLVSVLAGWRFVAAWPLGMAIAGLSGIVAGLAYKRKLLASYFVPSLCFLFLGLAFSAFSFGWIAGGFVAFIVVWWPALLILGGILLFVAYGLSRRSRDLSERSRRRGGRSGT
jgi:hypothetical protein